MARQQNFTRAAEELHLSQPALSRQVKDLEEELGVKLFDRSGKGVALTQAGQVLVEQANRILTLVRETEQVLADVTGLLRGTLLIGASTTIGMYLLPHALKEFHRRFPRIKIGLRIANTHQVEQMVLHREVDLGFIGARATARRELRIEAYMIDELVLILPVDHPLAKRGTVQFSELKGESFILREEGSATRVALERALQGQGLLLEPVMELGSTEAIKWAVAEGLGISVISCHAVSWEEQVGRLCVARLEELSLRRPLSIIYLKDRQPSPAARVFLQLLRQAQTKARPPDPCPT